MKDSDKPRDHRDYRINELLDQLNLALIYYERTTGRGATLVLIPHMPDERIVRTKNGRHMPGMKLSEFLRGAMAERRSKRVSRY